MLFTLKIRQRQYNGIRNVLLLLFEWFNLFFNNTWYEINKMIYYCEIILYNIIYHVF